MQTKKQKIKQKIMATVVVLFMMVMMFGTVDLSRITATVTNTALLQNFNPGTMGHQAMTSLVFNDITIGVAVNSLQNMTITNVWDLRGSGAGWSLSGTVNSLMIATGGGVNNLSNAFIAWNPAGGALTAISGTTTGIGIGAAAYFDGGLRTLLNTTTNNGMGNYRMNNVMFNIVYNGRADMEAGLFQATLTMTSS